MSAVPQARSFPSSFPTLGELKTWLIILLYLALSVALPYAVHSVPNAGSVLLPLYFFALVSGLTSGTQVGTITGLAVAPVSLAVSGMPPLPWLWLVMIKAGLLGIFAGLISQFWVKNLLGAAILAILASQVAGSLLFLTLPFGQEAAWSDFTIGLPGLLAQATLAPLLAHGWQQYKKKGQ